MRRRTNQIDLILAGCYAKYVLSSFEGIGSKAGSLKKSADPLLGTAENAENVGLRACSSAG